MAIFETGKVALRCTGAATINVCTSFDSQRRGNYKEGAEPATAGTMNRSLYASYAATIFERNAFGFFDSMCTIAASRTSIDSCAERPICLHRSSCVHVAMTACGMYQKKLRIVYCFVACCGNDPAFERMGL